MLQHRGAAAPLVDHPRRDLAGPEPGDPELLAHLAVGVLQLGLQLVELDLDGEADPSRAQLLDVSFHAGITPRFSPGRHGTRGPGMNGVVTHGYGRPV